MQRRSVELVAGLIVALVFSGGIQAHADQSVPPNAADSYDIFQRMLFGSETPLADFTQTDGWLGGLSVSGFFQNTSGMWIDSSNLTKFGRQAGEHHGANSLATQRELLQLDLNYLLNADNAFFLRFWGVYEPPYPWEAHNIAGATGVFNQSQSQIYNRYDVREAYAKTIAGPLT
ncbi:MAG: hypothetical protein ACREQC_09080, partial [Candidatus Binataceae bacterium]